MNNNSKNYICTLYEGHYQFGLAALVNSLVAHGYQGEIFAGYRGSLPVWCDIVQNRGDERICFQVTGNVRIYFDKLTTVDHLTNHKVEYMLRILGEKGWEGSRVYYFDPDITIKCAWGFFEEWVKHGVALCEDVNSPIPINHPRRKAWVCEFEGIGLPYHNNTDVYYNGGFIGLKGPDHEFLQQWKKAMEVVTANIGTLAQSQFSFSPEQAHPSNPFNKTDQDALNMAVMLTTVPISAVGKEGMDFIPGGWLMSHALGKRKPWRKSLLIETLRGYPPGTADKQYWRYANGAITTFPSIVIWIKLVALRLASFAGRVYRRNPNG